MRKDALKNGNEAAGRAGKPEKPELYDKDGRKVIGKPEEGVTYYDKDGRELKPPKDGKGGPCCGRGPGGPGGKPPKMYDKDGREVDGRPEEGVTYYDADGNELKKPGRPPEK